MPGRAVMPDGPVSNRFSIGIELDNLGRLAWTAGRFVAECGREVELEQVFVDV